MQSIPLTASLPTPQPQAAAATRPFNHSTKPKRVQMSLSMLPPPFNQASSSSTTTTTTYPPSTQQQPNKSILNPFSIIFNLSGIELPEHSILPKIYHVYHHSYADYYKILRSKEP
ncbi:hypothetical protein KEM48_003924 [Puccinia striiformis f. sp. tritici PST-130]|nr:hypothetical protein KEM48_003924 [Puccinia striiformis f. sp. tritici PST-130]